MVHTVHSRVFDFQVTFFFTETEKYRRNDITKVEDILQTVHKALEQEETASCKYII